jgi:hypothetical protein
MGGLGGNVAVMHGLIVTTISDCDAGFYMYRLRPIYSQADVEMLAEAAHVNSMYVRGSAASAQSYTPESGDVDAVINHVSVEQE